MPPKYGIDWDKVDERNNARLETLRPTQTAVTEQGAGRAKSTRAKRDAEPTTVTTRTRRNATPKTVDTGEATTTTTEVVKGDSDNVSVKTRTEGGTGDEGEGKNSVPSEVAATTKADPNEGIDREPEDEHGKKV